MSLSDLGSLLFPQWLQDWIRFELILRLGLQPHQLLLGMFRGMFDTILLLFLGLSLLTGGRTYMMRQYTLTPDTQATVLKWAVVADSIARRFDIPREVPLVLWFKENSMLAENPELCTGIIGAYDLVRSGEHPCFTPGPISDLEVSRQLAIGAAEYKERCPDITYYTVEPELIKRCYFAYNAGSGAAGRLDANESAYVMNNYDDNYRNMVYSDIILGTVQVQQLGAWPTHLAMQSLIATELDSANPTLSIALLDGFTRFYDWASYQLLTGEINSNVSVTFPAARPALAVESCLNNGSLLGELFTPRLESLRPSLNPVTESPILTQDVHGCHYALPGVDISSDNPSAILQAPMPGELTTYTDQWYNSTIRIENDEWIIFLLHPRSYLLKEGFVKRGEAIGLMGDVGNATGPHVHYTIYDKQSGSFVDPALFLP